MTMTMTMTNSISFTDRCNYVDHTVLRRKKKILNHRFLFKDIFSSQVIVLHCFFVCLFFLTRHNLALTT